ncbi:hypothetical protein [Stenotrophomonas phage IME-SM1]|uniref:Uncharacterized protein n=1 Tax=Stenotrophomonas phage IME-SM1 TaxID=1654717 RepID=A0A0H4ITR7_9CAUD|nr:hypothetical protein KMC40_gp039 [Stenotrophomonas phage IME-SM1]AKO61719.1 hypothetical protein [Stenotrophomonas phage IME-SM1]
MSTNSEKAYRIRDYLINKKKGGSLWNLEPDSINELIDALNKYTDPREIQSYLDEIHFWGFNTSILAGEPVDSEFLAALEYAEKPDEADLEREISLAAHNFVAWFLSGNNMPAPAYDALNERALDDLHRLVKALEAGGYREGLTPQN